MSLISRAASAVTTPTKTGFTAAQVAADVVKYGTPALAVLEAVENIPGLGLGVAGPAQGVIAGVVTVLTAVLSVLSQQKVAAVKAAVAVKAAKKAAK